MRKRGKVDANQPGMVANLRDLGVSVEPIHQLGNGVPDLLCGFRGRNVLLELKSGSRPCDRRLTADEEEWHRGWRGQVAVVSTLQEALMALGMCK